MATETERRIDTGGTVYPTAGNGGITRRDWLAGQFAAAWIQALTQRIDKDGYTDTGAAIEAARLGYITADAMIEEGKR